MKGTTTIEVFRCSRKLKENLTNSARLHGLNNSSYIRWAITMANRMINQQATKDDA
jgi:hypothetical protein